MKLEIERDSAGLLCRNKSLRFQVDQRRVVLMNRADKDALARRASRLCQCLAPTIVSIVADPTPIDRAQHDRFARTKQHEPMRKQRVRNDSDRLHAHSRLQRMPHRRSHVGHKRRQ